MRWAWGPEVALTRIAIFAAEGFARVPDLTGAARERALGEALAQAAAVATVALEQG